MFKAIRRILDIFGLSSDAFGIANWLVSGGVPALITAVTGWGAFHPAILFLMMIGAFAIGTIVYFFWNASKVFFGIKGRVRVSSVLISQEAHQDGSSVATVVFLAQNTSYHELEMKVGEAHTSINGQSRALPTNIDTRTTIPARGEQRIMAGRIPIDRCPEQGYLDAKLQYGTADLDYEAHFVIDIGPMFTVPLGNNADIPCTMQFRQREIRRIS